MDLNDIFLNARKRLQGVCKVCPVCNGKDCIGNMPGMGGKGTGSSFRNNIAALEKVLLNLSTIHEAVNPDTTYKLFNYNLEIPVMGAPMCETSRNFRGKIDDTEFIESQVFGAKEAGTIAMIGDAPQVELYEMGVKAIQKVAGMGIPIIKPREHVDLMKRIRLAEQAGAVAVGIDIDAAGFSNMAKAGQPVGPKSVAQLRDIIKNTFLPVILKGVMTKDDALKAVEAGAAGIVVSNHGGRSLDSTPGTADVLPEIAQTVGAHIKIFMDGGVRSGEDVLKALALGAEAVLIGRPVAIAAIGGQVTGVRLFFELIKEELKRAMLLTGCDSLGKINLNTIRMRVG